MMRFKSFIESLPRWYIVLLGIVFIAYVGGWAYTIHLAHTERASGVTATYITPVGLADSQDYAILAESIIHGHFSEPTEQYEYFHSPGYPAFVSVLLLIFGGSFFAVTFVQILLVFAIALMTVVIARSFVPESVGLWASLLFLVNPVVPQNTITVLTDILFAFLFILGILLLLKYAEKKLVLSTIVASLCFAAAAYVRPVGFFEFPIFIAPLIPLALSWRQKLFSAIAIVLIVTALLVPWMVRNKIDSGVFSFSSLATFDMAYINIPHFWADTTGLPFGQGITKIESQSGVPLGVQAGPDEYPVNWVNLSYSPGLNNYLKKVLLASPLSYASWHLYNSIGFFINPSIETNDPRINLKLLVARGHIVQALQVVASPWWLLVERLSILIGLLLGIIGVWALRKEPLVWSFVFIILYLAALGGPSSQARYRLPVEPILSIFMVTGIFFVLKIVRTLNLKKQHNILLR